MTPTIFTIGHSTRSLEDFLGVLRAHAIEALVDVRRFPGSRRLPQFQSDALAAALDRAGIAYGWIPSLGGRRRPAPDSPNTAWRHPAFRAYADHLATEEFADGIGELLMVARGLRAAVMCAEVLWWRCHRRLVADALVSIGVPVVHLRDEREGAPHRLTSPAALVGGVLSYTAAG